MRSISVKKTEKAVDYDALAHNLQSRRNLHAGFGSDKATARISFGLESMGSDTQSEVDSHVEDLGNTLKQEVGDTAWHEELTEGQKDAGIIVMNASGSPEEYHAVATGAASESDALMDTTSAEVQNISQESYDARELENMMPISIAFNVGAARQDNAMETIFPTISLSADQAGLTLQVTRTMIYYDWKHLSKGEATAALFEQKNLIDALIDSSILRNQATEIIPLYDPTVSIFDTDVGPFEATMDNATITTGAILFNTPFNLISAGANSTTNPFGVKDQTDTLDQLVRLNVVYVEITAADGTVSYVPLNVLDLPYTQFQKAQEGNERRVTLSWSSTTIPLSGNYNDKTGVPAPALAAFRTAPYDKYILMLKVVASGELNLADGNGELIAGSVAIDKVYTTGVDANGNADMYLVSDPAEITAAKNLFKSLRLKSFTVKAFYANLNRRERGLLVRQDVRRIKYTIQMQPPVTALKPVTETASGYNIDGAIQATRIQNTIAGIAELLHMDDMLSRYHVSISRQNDVPDIPGIGAYSLRPYYSHRTIDVTTLINSTNSHTLGDDISNGLTLFMRDEFAKAIMVSGWMAAQECTSGGAKEKPTAVVLTDPRTSQWMYTKGDTRVLGDSFNCIPVVSNYLEFRDKIYIVPRREASVQNPDGLNFGNMFWLPELITNLPIARGGQISNEFTVQTRRRHIVHCPVMIRIDLQNIGKVLDSKVPMAVSI